MRNAVRVSALAVMVLLAGCRMGVDLAVVSEDEIAASVEIAFDKSQAQILNLSADKLCAQMDLPGTDSAKTRIEPIDTADEVGCRVSGTGALSSAAEEAGLSLEDGIWTFKMDDSSQGYDPSGMDMSDQGVELYITVTFPGEVLSHSGSSRVEGTTVIWDNLEDFASSEGIWATARDQGLPVDASRVGAHRSGASLGIGTGPAIAIGLLVVAAAIALILVVRSRRKAQAAAAGDGQAPMSSPPTGPTDWAQTFGQPGAAPDQRAAPPQQWSEPAEPTQPQEPSPPTDATPPQDQDRPPADPPSRG